MINPIRPNPSMNYSDKDISDFLLHRGILAFRKQAGFRVPMITSETYDKIKHPIIKQGIRGVKVLQTDACVICTSRIETWLKKYFFYRDRLIVRPIKEIPHDIDEKCPYCELSYIPF